MIRKVLILKQHFTFFIISCPVFKSASVKGFSGIFVINTSLALTLDSAFATVINDDADDDADVDTVEGNLISLNPLD